VILRPLDWLVIGVYFCGVLAVGFFFSRRVRTADEYLLGGRNMRPSSVGLSLFASLISIISYLSTPGEISHHGPGMLWYIAAMPIVFVVVGYLIIPYFMKLPVTSAYEILERRFGVQVRLMGSLIFLLIRLVWMSLIIYTLSDKVVVLIMGLPDWSTPYVCAAIGMITVIYTTMGGLRAVVFADVIQTFILFLGAILTVIVATARVGGLSWWPTHWRPNWDVQPVFSFDPHVRLTVVGTLVSALLWWICTAGADQMAIQRYLATRDAKAARRAFLVANVADCLVLLLLAVVGFAVLGFFETHHAVFAEFVRAHPEVFKHGGDIIKDNADKLFPTFIVKALPIGITGLIISALLSAAMSALSAGINSTSTVISVDLIERFRTVPSSDRRRVGQARVLSIVVGAVVVGIGTLIGKVPGNLYEVAGKTSNLFIAPLFGLFFMALFVPFATSLGTILGTVCGLGAAVLVGYWDVITGRPPLSFQWILPCSLIVNILAGCLWSLLLPKRDSSSIAAGASRYAAPPAADIEHKE